MDKILASEVIKNFDKLYYMATDGIFYPVKEVYPLCMATQDKYKFMLDTGGEMASCDFFEAKIEDDKLYRKMDTGAWKSISPKVEFR